MLNLDIFLTQEDTILLIQSLTTLALGVNAAESRRDILTNAGVHRAFCCGLIYEISPHLFAQQLVARFRDYRVSAHQHAYHPMIRLLEYLLHTQELEDQDRNLFLKLVGQGWNNFNGLSACSAVGRIESPEGEAIGTGVYVGGQHLLTCYHVIEYAFERGQGRAWVRFGYKAGRYGTESGEIFELNIKDSFQNTAISNKTLDYALVKITSKPELPAPNISHKTVYSEQEIRLIHHPRGEPVQISDIGLVVQADQEFIKHNIETDYGSSGAPIFDLNWRVVALQRGSMIFSRPAAPGISEGIPIAHIWQAIRPYLESS